MKFVKAHEEIPDERVLHHKDGDDILLEAFSYRDHDHCSYALLIRTGTKRAPGHLVGLKRREAIAFAKKILKELDR